MDTQSNSPFHTPFFGGPRSHVAPCAGATHGPGQRLLQLAHVFGNLAHVHGHLGAITVPPQGRPPGQEEPCNTTPCWVLQSLQPAEIFEGSKYQY